MGGAAALASQKAKIAQEAAWLAANPDFAERPASVREFLGPDYLNIESGVREAVKQVLVDIFGEEPNSYKMSRYRQAIATGGIGWGKSTVASIALVYMVHWLLCLKDPQGFFGLLPGSRIACMMMSTSEAQARQVIFSDIKARIENSPWFKRRPFDPKFRNQIRWSDKDIWIIPGDSSETTFEGYNILAGVIDEIDSHKVTKQKDYAEQGYCVDPETEILTTEGWKRYDELKVGESVLTLNHDTGLSEWQPVEEVCVFPARKREMVRMEGREFSSLSTPNHRWPIVDSKGRRRFVTTETLTAHHKLVLSARSADRPIEPKFTDALVEAVAWFWTEGTIDPRHGRQATIYQKAGTPGAERIRACLRQVFGEPVDSFPRTGSKTDGVPRWRENLNRHLCEFRLSVDAAAVLMEHAPGRVVTREFLMSLTQAQLELFIRVSLEADNCGENKLAQKDSEAADRFAFACILAGKGVSYRTIPDRVGCGYEMSLIRILKKGCVNPVAAERAPGSAFRIESEDYEGIIWCPRVKNSTWLARRKGSVYFTGNTTIYSRMTSRFGDRGFVFCVGQMKYEGSFASRHYEEFKKDPDSYAVKLALWESIGWENFLLPDGTRNSFYYDIRRKKILSKEMGDALGGADGEDLIEVPNAYRRDFENDPAKALRDLAGIPPSTESPFILFDYKIEDSRELWKQKALEFYGTDQEPVRVNGVIEPWFRAPNTVPRVAHIDIGVSNDALGIAVGHSPGMVEVEGEQKPFIFIDMLYRIVAPPGGQIELAHARQLLYMLRDNLGFRFKKVTLDSYQSTDMMQQLNRRRFRSELLSMDRTIVPYYDLREALYEDRLAMPMLMSHWRPEDPPLDILRKELVQLQDLGVKIDHPPEGSKDVADAVAGVVSSIMAGSRTVASVGAMAPSVVGQSSAPAPQVQHRAVRADRGGIARVPWRPAVVRRGVR